MDDKERVDLVHKGGLPQSELRRGDVLPSGTERYKSLGQLSSVAAYRRIYKRARSALIREGVRLGVSYMVRDPKAFHDFWENGVGAIVDNDLEIGTATMVAREDGVFTLKCRLFERQAS